jgi:anti-anti-sigma regulatory factor
MSARIAAILKHGSRADEADARAPVVSSNVLLSIVNARGVLDSGSAVPLSRELRQSVEAGATKLLVDLTQADEVTTACINTMLDVRQRLVARGGEIAVALPPWLRRQFESLGLGRRFHLAEDRTEAARLLGLVGDGSFDAGSSVPRHAHAA